MSFDSVAEFLAMGNHGLYVWLSYGVSLLVVVANALAPGMKRRRFLAQARALERRRAAAQEHAQ